MSDDVNYKNNPLHGLSLKNMLIEIVDHYGFEILYAYLALNCFKSNPSIESSVIFLKKTDWAREKVEAFYMYDFKNLPQASSEEFETPPRDRIIPEGQTTGEPKELSLEDAQYRQEKREKKASEHKRGGYGAKKSYAGNRGSYSKDRDNRRSHQSDNESSNAPAKSNANPWGNVKIKPET